MASAADQPDDLPGARQLPDLVASRLCHDLISPLGAIGNGVELLELSGGTSGPELQLMRDSAQQAQARIRLFRIAFGNVRPDQTIGADELRGILRDYRAQLRFDLDWTPEHVQPKHRVKLGLLALLCLESALPFGGHVLCTLSDGGLRVVAQADQPSIDTALWAALDGTARWPDDLRAAQVQFPMLAQAVAAQGMWLDVKLSTDGVDLQIMAD